MAHERGLELRAVDFDEVDGVGRLLLHYVRLEFAISDNTGRVFKAGGGGVLIVIQGRSRLMIHPRIHTMP